MSNYIKRIKLLTELLEEGHITEQEFYELVDVLRGKAVNEAYDEHTITLGGGFELEGFEDYHECKRDEAFTDKDNDVVPMQEYENTDPAFTSQFRDYIDSKGEWERVIKTIKGKQVPVWIPIDKHEKKELSEYDRFVNGEIDRIHVKDHPAYESIKEALNSGKMVFGSPLHNHIIDDEVSKSINSLYKQDIYSGNILRSYEWPFTSEEHNV